ncbi:FAD-binding oxidoreductase [Rhodocaloribacter litoris]|uniref:FAD-binding oxidoreductase n=1 Tax=Rhodocaloribacter litoris TaxID=2558931 RepID=UPI0014226B93|nr:FAD-binding oxidoreductase [Rhodocaloribacter litoris]QXD15818.1 FAD-binding oxidoreductase [Rhodocaloribacter litoris]
MEPLRDAQTGAFRKSFRGEVLLPGDRDYDRVRRIWNGMFDRRPAIIARCAGTADVINAVHFARDNGLLVAVRGGGHNSAGNAVCDGGIMIDLSLMRRVNVDPENRTARVDGGALLGDMDRETQLYGLAVSGGGIVSHTGVGGLTLGGGFGWISRKHGLAVDNLLAAEVVTADGRLLTASAGENPDLFWGIRGGGGNFGVVTSFRFRCVEVGPHVYSGLIVKRFEDAKRYMQFHRDYVRGLPDAMTAWIVVRHAPPLPFLPPEVHGQRVVVVPFVWLGDEAEGARLIRPIREATPSLGEAVGMNPWVAWQAGFDGLVEHGARNYWKSHHLTALSDACIDRILEFAETMPTKEIEVFIPHMEGAPGRVPETATAYAHRKTPFVLNIHTRWRDAADDARCLAWARAFHQATEPFARGVYVNFLSDEGEDRVRAAYIPEVWDRLVEVKKEYDPENLFRMNQNIRPS